MSNRPKAVLKHRQMKNWNVLIHRIVQGRRVDERTFGTFMRTPIPGVPRPSALEVSDGGKA